ncbi:hypothetical protein M9H77_11253 [Catharanthus roseus]|uniref:Uncharacterized protein n=1 Tax=Catharanthus roseus TaxID=4058 RepID=A0ACC0BE11_CATRO|nr:hypothetical protein M9H77_11253 [Catharanthus roseus]
MVRGSKKRAHPIAASTPSGMSPSSAVSILVETSNSSSSGFYSSGRGFYTCGTSTPLEVASTPPTTLTPFAQLPYSSSAPTSTPSASFATGLSLRPALSSSARPPALATLFTPSSLGVFNSRFLILPTADWYTRRGGRRHSRTCYRGVVAKGPASTLAGLGLLLSGERRWARPLHSRNCMSYCISRRDSGLIHDPTSFR